MSNSIFQTTVSSGKSSSACQPYSALCGLGTHLLSFVATAVFFVFFFYTDTTEENRTYFSLFLSSGESFQLNTCYEVNALSFSLGFEKATGISHGGKATQCQQIKIETWSFFFLGIFSFFFIS